MKKTKDVVSLGGRISNFSENRIFNIADEDKAYVEELFEIYYDQLQ